MLGSMYRKFWSLLGRVSDAASVGQLLWGWTALVTLVSALGTWAASTIEPVSNLGWGAVVFAGVGAACVLLILTAVNLFAWRYFKPLPASENPVLITTQPSTQSDTQVIPLGEDRLARGEIDGLKETIQFQIKRINDLIEYERQQRRNFQELISNVLRARDAEQLLKNYSGRAEILYEKLRRADPHDYAGPDEWANEFGEWQSNMYDFWRTADGWVKHLPDPFRPETKKLGAVNPPDSIIITPFENQHRYRTMVVVQDWLVSSKDRVLASISNAANPPG